jgi:hypothetical protein
VLLITATVLVAAYTATFLYFNDAVLGDFISARVNKAERGTFTLQHARYRWGGGLASILLNVPTRVIGEGYELRDPDGNLVLSVPYVETDVYLQELIASLIKMAVRHRFHLTLHFAHAWVPDAFGVIAPTRASWGAHPSETSEVNIVAAMSARHPTPPDGGELHITVDDLTLDDVSFGLGFPNKRGGLSWYGRFRDGAGRASLEYSSSSARETADGPYFFFKVMPLKAPSGALQLGDFHFPLETLEALEFGPDGTRRQDLVFHATARTPGWSE